MLVGSRLAWGHVVRTAGEVYTNSNTLEIGHADDGVFLSLRIILGSPVVPRAWRAL